MKIQPTALNQNGFTLIELVVVSVLLAIMATILYGSITGIMGGRDAIKSQRQTGTLAQFVLERMSRDLISRELIPLTNQEGASTPNTGFRGFGAQKYFEGTNASKDEANADSIRFVTNNVPQVTSSTVPNFGLIEVSYRLEKPKDRDADERAPRYVLIRDEKPAEISEQNKELLEKRTRSLPLADNVAGLNFRYLLNGEWQESWQNAQRPLPEAIEITLELLDELGDTQKFRTAIFVSKQPGRRS